MRLSVQMQGVIFWAVIMSPSSTMSITGVGIAAASPSWRSVKPPQSLAGSQVSRGTLEPRSDGRSAGAVTGRGHRAADHRRPGLRLLDHQHRQVAEPVVDRAVDLRRDRPLPGGDGRVERGGILLDEVAALEPALDVVDAP